MENFTANPKSTPRIGRRSTVSRLRVYRIATGLSQAELAERAGLSVETIRNTELGKHKPWRTTRRLLGKALHVEADALFPEVGDG